MNLSDLRTGMRLTDFYLWGCLPARAVRIVRRNANGDLYVRCREGEHVLSGQVGEAGELCGCEVLP